MQNAEVPATLAVLFVVVALAVFRQLQLLTYISWGDEAETVLASKMLANGWQLYDQVFNHHGPLTFLPGYLFEKLRDSGIYAHRFVVACLQWATFVLVSTSPLLQRSNLQVKVLFAGLFITISVAYFPEYYAHMMTYQGLTGLLLASILACYALPAIVMPDQTQSWRHVVGSAGIVCLPFLASNYIIPCVLLAVATFRAGRWKYCLAGYGIGLIFNLAFLEWLGSVSNFLVETVYVNASILSNYGDLTTPTLFKNAVDAITRDLPGFGLFVWVAACLLRLSQREASGRLPWRWIPLGFALGAFLLRDFFTHHLPYLYGALVLMLVWVEREGVRTPLVRYGALVALLFVAAIKLPGFLPADQQRYAQAQAPSDTPFARLARELTDPSDPIVSYSFSSLDYLLARRLPASGQFFYLPWQADLEKLGLRGLSLDACRDIRQTLPKVMKLDKWKVFGLYSWDSYGGCIDQVARDHYDQIEGTPFYVRRDIRAAVRGRCIPAVACL